MIFLGIQYAGKAQGIDTLLTPQEIRWLNQNGHNLKFTPNPAWPPADYIDENGVHQGIVADYLKLFEEMLGVQFEHMVYNNWSEMLDGLEHGEADFVGAIEMSAERERYLNFTEPYLTTPLVLIIRNDYPAILTDAHISRMNIAVVKDYTSGQFLKNTYAGIVLSEYEDDLTALVQTSLGNTDGTIIDLMTASYLIERYGISNLALGKQLDYVWQIRFASVKDKPLLNSILEKLLNEIDQEQRQAIYQKWIKINSISKRSTLERNIKWLIRAFIVVSLLILCILYYNHHLKKQIKLRTADLEKEIQLKEEREKELKKVLKDREVLLAEVHHRVKNNLAVVIGLIQLESMNLEEELTNQMFSNCISRIKAIAVIHEQLYQADELHYVPFHRGAAEVIKHFSNRYPSVNFEVNIDDIYLNINNAVPAALLLNEILTYLGEYDRIETININLLGSAEKVNLNVSFKGPVTFKAPADEFLLLRTLSRQLKGSFSIHEKEEITIAVTFKKLATHGSSGNPIQI